MFLTTTYSPNASNFKKSSQRAIDSRPPDSDVVKEEKRRSTITSPKVTKDGADLQKTAMILKLLLSLDEGVSS